MIIYYINFIVHSVKERELLAKKEDEKRQKELKRQEQAEQRRKQAEVCSLLHIKFLNIVQTFYILKIILKEFPIINYSITLILKTQFHCSEF